MAASRRPATVRVALAALVAVCVLLVGGASGAEPSEGSLPPLGRNDAVGALQLAVGKAGSASAAPSGKPADAVRVESDSVGESGEAGTSEATPVTPEKAEGSAKAPASAEKKSTPRDVSAESSAPSAVSDGLAALDKALHMNSKADWAGLSEALDQLMEDVPNFHIFDASLLKSVRNPSYETKTRSGELEGMVRNEVHSRFGEAEERLLVQRSELASMIKEQFDRVRLHLQGPIEAWKLSKFREAAASAQLQAVSHVGNVSAVVADRRASALADMEKLSAAKERAEKLDVGALVRAQGQGNSATRGPSTSPSGVPAPSPTSSFPRLAEQRVELTAGHSRGLATLLDGIERLMERAGSARARLVAMEQQKEAALMAAAAREAVRRASNPSPSSPSATDRDDARADLSQPVKEADSELKSRMAEQERDKEELERLEGMKAALLAKEQLEKEERDFVDAEARTEARRLQQLEEMQEKESKRVLAEAAERARAPSPKDGHARAAHRRSNR